MGSIEQGKWQGGGLNTEYVLRLPGVRRRRPSWACREGHSGVHRVCTEKAGRGTRTVHGRCEEHVP